MRNVIWIVLLLATAGVSYGQEDKLKRALYMRTGILTDSASTLMIPVDVLEIASSKTVDVNYSCANLIFYDFVQDNSFRLFDRNTCVMTYQTSQYGLTLKEMLNRNVLKNWILYRVKNIDYDKNGKIDSDDPDILYSSDIYGRNLKQLTTEHEHVLSIDVYHEQNFALITLQRDVNRDGNYDRADRAYSYVKLDLATLSLGKEFKGQ